MIQTHSVGVRICTMLEHEYGMNIPHHNPHFIMGTMKRRPRQFLLIGILRSTLDPQELAKQASLFG